MVQRLVRKDIKSCEVIYQHPDYFLFGGKQFQSCSRQGGPLYTYSEVNKYLDAYAILPENKLLVTDSKGIYHVLDLAAGKVLISKQMPRSVISTRRFAVTDCGKTAYRIWLYDDKYYIAIFNLSDLSYRLIPYNSSLSHVGDLVVKSQDELLVLESQVICSGVCNTMVTSVLVKDWGCIITPEYQWECDRFGKVFDGRYVLESGYMIRDLHSGLCFSLLEHSDIQLPGNHGALSHIYYSDNKCLQLVDGTQTVFIDCEQRKVIARYQRNTTRPSFIGLLMGNELWFGKTDGIYAIPFPIVEEM